MAQLTGLPPFPTGWFAVAFSDDIAAGSVHTIPCFGQEIVLYRTEAGEAVAVDPFCPHLGAHLGHGGCVVRESIVCPFHHWRFDREGRCVSIRGATKLPERGRLTPWPLVEQDGVICVFHDAERSEARVPREPFPFPPLGGEGFTPNRTVTWTLRTHPQEVGENTVDMAHLLPIHGVVGAHVVGKPRVDGSHLNVVLAFVAPGDSIGMPGQDNDVELDVILDGLGRIVSRTHVRNVGVRARQAIDCTPIDGDRMVLRGVVNTRKSDDAAFTESLAELFYDSFVHDFQKDFPIWENKRYAERPILSAADGPVGLYRRWSRQFYPAAASSERGAPALPGEDDARHGSARGTGSSWGTGRLDPRSLLQRLEGRVRAFVASGRGLVEAGTAGLRGAADGASRGAEGERGGEGDGEGGNEGESVGESRSEPGVGRVESVKEYFDTLGQRFRPGGAAGVDAVFQWKLSGRDGTDRYAVVRDGGIAMFAGEHGKPTVTIAMDADDYVRMVNGEIDGALAFTTGRAKLSGSIPMAMKMRKIFPQ